MKKDVKAFKTIEVNVVNPDFFKVGEAYRWTNGQDEVYTGICKDVTNDYVEFVTMFTNSYKMYVHFIATERITDMQHLT